MNHQDVYLSGALGSAGLYAASPTICPPMLLQQKKAEACCVGSTAH